MPPSCSAEGFYEYKTFFLTYHDIIDNFIFFKNTSSSIKNLLLKLQPELASSLNLLIDPNYDSNHIKKIESSIFKTIQLVDEAIEYCKNHKNYNLLKPLQELERTTSQLVEIYNNLYPIISKNEQLKNFFSKNKNILYTSQETISSLNSLINNKNINDISSEINKIIDIFNKTTIIDFKNKNGNVDNLYYQMLSLYRTRISLIDYQKNLSSDLDYEKAEIYNIVNNFKDEIKNTKEVLNKEFERNKKNLIQSNENLNMLIQNQEEKIVNQSSKISSSKIEIDNLSQVLEKHINEQKDKINNNLLDTATIIQDDIQNTKENLDNEAKKLNITMENHKKIISLSTSEIMLEKFKTNSRIEMWTYYILNILSLAAIIFLVWETYQSIETYIATDIKKLKERDFNYILLKLSLTVISFFILVFISRISNKAHHHWKHNENIYLKLYALKPYISDMSPEKQLEIQEKLIDVYFGKEDKSDEKNNDLPENTIQIIKTLIEKLPLNMSKKED